MQAVRLGQLVNASFQPCGRLLTIPVIPRNICALPWTRISACIGPFVAGVGGRAKRPGPQRNLLEGFEKEAIHALTIALSTTHWTESASLVALADVDPP